MCSRVVVAPNSRSTATRRSDAVGRARPRPRAITKPAASAGVVLGRVVLGYACAVPVQATPTHRNDSGFSDPDIRRRPPRDRSATAIQVGPGIDQRRAPTRRSGPRFGPPGLRAEPTGGKTTLQPPKTTELLGGTLQGGQRLAPEGLEQLRHFQDAPLSRGQEIAWICRSWSKARRCGGRDSFRRNPRRRDPPVEIRRPRFEARPDIAGVTAVRSGR